MTRRSNELGSPEGTTATTGLRVIGAQSSALSLGVPVEQAAGPYSVRIRERAAGRRRAKVERVAILRQ